MVSETLEAVEAALYAMKRCEHDGGFDREIGPIGCDLGDKCVCIGLYPKVAKAAECIRVALSSPVEPESGWQPVKTAPKDGTFVFVWSSMKRRALAAWQGPNHRAGFYGVDDYGLLFDAARTGEVVTHWQPLPAPPEASQ